MISWAAVDPGNGELREERGQEELAAASTIKIFVASAFWRSGLDPDERVAVRDVAPTGDSFVEAFSPGTELTLADLALLMLAVSDNAATNHLLRLLGFDAVNDEIRRLGLERTVVGRPMLTPGPENLTCASDLALGLASLADDDRIVSPLGLSQHSDLRALLGPDVAVHSKSGELDTVRHEVALLDDRGRRLVTAVCSSPPARPEELAGCAAKLWREH